MKETHLLPHLALHIHDIKEANLVAPSDPTDEDFDPSLHTPASSLPSHDWTIVVNSTNHPTVWCSVNAFRQGGLNPTMPFRST